MADSSPDDVAQAERVAKPCTGGASTSNQPEDIDAAGESSSSSEPAPALPKLSAADFQVYNHMATHMEYYVRQALHCMAVLFPFTHNHVLFPLACRFDRDCSFAIMQDPPS
jgi:hypothetical protein